MSLSRDPVPKGQRRGPGLALLTPSSQGLRCCHQLLAAPGSCAALASHRAGAGVRRGARGQPGLLCLPGDGSGASLWHCVAPHGPSLGLSTRYLVG